MSLWSKIWGASVVIAMSAALIPSMALAQIKIGVLVSSSGPAAIIGVPQRNSALILPKTVAGAAIDYIILDDGGEPSAAVANAKKLIGDQAVDAIIGPSISPNAMAILNFVAEGKLPMLAAVGTDGVIFPMDDKRRWIFKTAQANRLILQVVVDNMVKSGVKTLALMRLNDSLGEEWAKSLGPIIEKAGITLADEEVFARSDNSVTAQALHIFAKRPDAVLIAATGASSMLADVALVDRGYGGRIYETNGAASDEFIRLGGKSVEGALMAAGPLQVVDELPDGDVIKKAATDYIAAYEKAYGAKPSTFGSNVYDAGLLLQAAIPEALKVAKPGTPEFREALRTALEFEQGDRGNPRRLQHDAFQSQWHGRPRRPDDGRQEWEVGTPEMNGLNVARPRFQGRVAIVTGGSVRNRRGHRHAVRP